MWLSHPELPSCKDCQLYLYDPKSWEVEKDENGQPRKRWKGCPLPCATCPKIPPGVEPIPANARELDDRGKSIYHYNLMLKEDVTAILPRDSITVANGAICSEVGRVLERAEHFEMMSTVNRAVIIAGGGKNGVRA